MFPTILKTTDFSIYVHVLLDLLQIIFYYPIGSMLFTVSSICTVLQVGNKSIYCVRSEWSISFIEILFSKLSIFWVSRFH